MTQHIVLDVCMIDFNCSLTQALIPLASENTDIGKIKAAQALAKITITSNPEIAFPGERVRITLKDPSQ